VTTPEEFWAERLGCDPSVFDRPRLTLLPPPRTSSLFAVSARDALVVSAPLELHGRLRAVAEPRALVSPSGLLLLLPAGARLVGPARIAYLHREVSLPEGVIALDSAEDPRLEALRAAVTSEEWRHANLAASEPPLFACAVGGALAAACGYERLLGRVAHLGVLAHPAQRGRGLARRAVQAAAATAWARGLLPQYQTLAANAPALALAESLGFEPFATTLSGHFTL
jgi:RimJ/RimL family protein N-acetyltransferase